MKISTLSQNCARQFSCLSPQAMARVGSHTAPERGPRGSHPVKRRRKWHSRATSALHRLRPPPESGHSRVFIYEYTPCFPFWGPHPQDGPAQADVDLRRAAVPRFGLHVMLCLRRIRRFHDEWRQQQQNRLAQGSAQEEPRCIEGAGNCAVYGWRNCQFENDRPNARNHSPAEAKDRGARETIQAACRDGPSKSVWRSELEQLERSRKWRPVTGAQVDGAAVGRAAASGLRH